MALATMFKRKFTYNQFCFKTGITASETQVQNCPLLYDPQTKQQFSQ